jgi:hypothetical protein
MFLYLSNDLIILSVSATRHPANIVHNSELQVTSPAASRITTFIRTSQLTWKVSRRYLLIRATVYKLLFTSISMRHVFSTYSGPVFFPCQNRSISVMFMHNTLTGFEGLFWGFSSGSSPTFQHDAHLSIFPEFPFFLIISYYDFTLSTSLSRGSVGFYHLSYIHNGYIECWILSSLFIFVCYV